MLSTLGEHPNIVGVKLACGGVAKVARVRAQFDPEQFSALAGQSDWLLPALTVRGTGVITGLANLYPKARAKTIHPLVHRKLTLNQACIEIFDLYTAGKIKKAGDAQLKIAQAEWGFAKSGINSTKWVVAKYLGYPESSCHSRRPYPMFADAKKEAWITQTLRLLEVTEKKLSAAK